MCAVFPGPGTTQLWLFPGGQQRLPLSSQFPLGRWDLGWDGQGYPSQPFLPFCIYTGSDPRKVSSSWAWERGKVLDDSRSCLSPSPHPSFLGAVLCPCGVSEPALTLMPVSPSHGLLGVPGVGGKRLLVSCHSLQASPVFPLCPPWGTGRVGEERKDPELLGEASPKRLP